MITCFQLVLACQIASVPSSPAAAGGADGQIHKLIWEHEAAVAIALLEKNPSLISARNDLQQTPLHVAAYRGRTRLVSWLLAHDADVNAIAYSKFTPLHLAANGTIAKLLIRAGAKLELTDNWGNTPLQFAAEREMLDVVAVLLESGAEMDLRTAVILRRRDVIESLVEQNLELPRVPTKSHSLGGCSTSLAHACSVGNIELVQLLLTHGADVNEETFQPNAWRNASALTNAVWSDNVEVVRMLLEQGARTNVSGGKFYPGGILEYARANSDPEIVELLERYESLDPPADPVQQSDAPAPWMIVVAIVLFIVVGVWLQRVDRTHESRRLMGTAK